MKLLTSTLLVVFVSFFANAQDTSKPQQPDLKGDLQVDFGLNFWTKQPANLPDRMWGSQSFTISYTQRFRISDRLSFHPTAGFSFENYAFNSNYTWMRNTDGSIGFRNLVDVEILRNRLNVNYFDIPLEIRIHPLRTVAGEGWFIGLAPVAGIRLGAHTDFKYQIDEVKTREQLYSDFNIDRFRYGAQGRFGFRTFHLFYKMYFNDLFTDTSDLGGVSPTVYTIGINFSGF